MKEVVYKVIKCYYDPKKDKYFKEKGGFVIEPKYFFDKDGLYYEVGGRNEVEERLKNKKKEEN